MRPDEVAIGFDFDGPLTPIGKPTWEERMRFAAEVALKRPPFALRPEDITEDLVAALARGDRKRFERAMPAEALEVTEHAPETALQYYGEVCENIAAIHYDRGRLKDYVSAEAEEETHYWELRDERATLEALHSAGHPLAVLSNNQDAVVRHEIDRWYPDIFDHVEGIRSTWVDNTYVKPAPEKLARIIGGELGVDHALYIGDSGVDMRAVRNLRDRYHGLHVKSVYIPCEHRDEGYLDEEAAEHGDVVYPDFQIATLSDIPDLLEDPERFRYQP